MMMMTTTSDDGRNSNSFIRSFLHSITLCRHNELQTATRNGEKLIKELDYVLKLTSGGDAEEKRNTVAAQTPAQKFLNEFHVRYYFD